MKRGKGRRILTSVAALTAVGGFLADWNRTHLLNPDRPPHARFHEALSITSARSLARAGRTSCTGGERSREGPPLCTLLPSLFWIAQGASFVFPRTEGLRAEFPKVPA